MLTLIVTGISIVALAMTIATFIKLVRRRRP